TTISSTSVTPRWSLTRRNMTKPPSVRVRPPVSRLGGNARAPQGTQAMAVPARKVLTFSDLRELPASRQGEGPASPARPRRRPGQQILAATEDSSINRKRVGDRQTSSVGPVKTVPGDAMEALDILAQRRCALVLVSCPRGSTTNAGDAGEDLS